MDASTVRALWGAGDWARLLPILQGWIAETLSVAWSLSGDDLDDLGAIVVERARRQTIVPDEPRAWVRVVARNAARDWMKSRAVRQRRDLGALADVTSDSDEACDRDARLEALRSALQTLDPTQHEAFVLYTLHGRSTREIAARLGISLANCRMRVSRSRRALKQALATAPALPVREYDPVTRARLHLAGLT